MKNQEDLMTQLAWAELFNHGKIPTGWFEARAEFDDTKGPIDKKKIRLVDIEIRDSHTGQKLTVKTITRAHFAKLQFEQKMHKDSISGIFFINR